MALLCSKLPKSQILLRMESRAHPWPLKFHVIVPLAPSLAFPVCSPCALLCSPIIMAGTLPQGLCTYCLLGMCFPCLWLNLLSYVSGPSGWVTPVRGAFYERPLKVARVFPRRPSPSFSSFMSLLPAFVSFLTQLPTSEIQFSDTNWPSSNSVRFWCWFPQFAQMPLVKGSIPQGCHSFRSQPQRSYPDDLPFYLADYKFGVLATPSLGSVTC